MMIVRMLMISSMRLNVSQWWMRLMFCIMWLSSCFDFYWLWKDIGSVCSCEYSLVCILYLICVVGLSMNWCCSYIMRVLFRVSVNMVIVFQMMVLILFEWMGLLMICLRMIGIIRVMMVVMSVLVVLLVSCQMIGFMKGFRCYSVVGVERVDEGEGFCMEGEEDMFFR